MMLIYVMQQLSNIWSYQFMKFMKKLSNIEAELKKLCL